MGWLKEMDNKLENGLRVSSIGVLLYIAERLGEMNSKLDNILSVIGIFN